jgi:predicted metal-dependent hydrolase
MKTDLIRIFTIQKLTWIKQQQKKLREQDRETPREYIEKESHYLWGKRYLLEVVTVDESPHVELTHQKVQLYTRPNTTEVKKQQIIDTWYREVLKEAIQPLINKWEPKMNVTVEKFFIQRMKTKWGSCTPSKNSIRINLELAKKYPECLEYIVVHEMVHLIEASHNKRFVALMNHLLPKWRSHRDELNRLPVRHEAWKY